MWYRRFTRGSLVFSACFALYGITPHASCQDAASADLTIRGDIASVTVLKPADLAALPHETVAVADQDGTKVNYDGVPLREILKRAVGQGTARKGVGELCHRQGSRRISGGLFARRTRHGIR